MKPRERTPSRPSARCWVAVVAFAPDGGGGSAEVSSFSHLVTVQRLLQPHKQSFSEARPKLTVLKPKSVLLSHYPNAAYRHNATLSAIDRTLLWAS